jgi:hypothetical protein
MRNERPAQNFGYDDEDTGSNAMKRRGVKYQCGGGGGGSDNGAGNMNACALNARTQHTHAYY